MTERLLQYIWQFQYFNKNELTTTDGDQLTVIHPGQYNHHQGPDFLDGRIKVKENVWAGSIELHINTSDWHRHSHSDDPNYDNVILHVVWNHDDASGDYRMPALLLGDRIPKLLLQQYQSWLKNDGFIACSGHIHRVKEIIWTSWKDRMLAERLQRKSGQILLLLQKNNFHWEETLWWLLARNFGLHVNADAFQEMAESIPYNLLSKHSNQIHQLEAMLFGQAGLLNGVHQDKYPLMLQKEFKFLQNKYLLREINMPVHFLRMRPACFPTVRLAQLAMLIHMRSQVFSSIINCQRISDIKSLLNVTANDYWHYHFTFEETTVYMPKTAGMGMTNNIIVNTVVPILFAYGEYKNEDRFKQKAVDWIRCLPPEKNAVIEKFRKLEITNKNAGESQALLELKTQYCDQRRCLDCAVGGAILKA